MHLLDAIAAQKTQKPPPRFAQDPVAHEILRELTSTMQRGYARGALQRRPHTTLRHRRAHSMAARRARNARPSPPRATPPPPRPLLPTRVATANPEWPRR